MIFRTVFEESGYEPLSRVDAAEIPLQQRPSCKKEPALPGLLAHANPLKNRLGDF